MESLHVASGAPEWSELLKAFREDYEILKSESLKAKNHKLQRFVQVNTDSCSRSSGCFFKARRISPRNQLQHQEILNKADEAPFKELDNSKNELTKDFRHQILNRTYRPPLSTTRLLLQAKSQQPIKRLEKPTILSNVKTRKELFYESREGASTPSPNCGSCLDYLNQIPIPMKVQEGIEMLLHYRKQVQQRLHMDHIYEQSKLDCIKTT
jgi:hypothetical protein